MMLMVIKRHKVSDLSENLHLSPRTVNSYRYRIFEKLGFSSDVELNLLSVRHGLIGPDATTSNDGRVGASCLRAEPWVASRASCPLAMAVWESAPVPTKAGGLVMDCGRSGVRDRPWLPHRGIRPAPTRSGQGDKDAQNGRRHSDRADHGDQQARLSPGGFVRTLGHPLR